MYSRLFDVVGLSGIPLVMLVLRSIIIYYSEIASRITLCCQLLNPNHYRDYLDKYIKIKHQRKLLKHLLCDLFSAYVLLFYLKICLWWKKTASTSCTCTNIKSIIIIVLYANRASEWRIQIRSTDYLRTRRFITRLHRRYMFSACHMD